MPGLPDVFPLPERAAKPRATGLTHVLDQGLGPAEVDSLLAVAGPHIDLVRLGWGSAFVTANLADKLARYRAGGVPVMVGGTLTELAWLHGRIDALCAFLHEHAIEQVEVSSGVVPIPPEEKHALIARLARDFTVYAEVGEKDSDAILAPYRWVELIRGALAAGAELVVCEGRATGTAGLYRADGEARTGLIDEIVHEVDLAQLVFEAPRKDQQSWLINRFGGHVNLGNVPPAEVISLESLRLGLRADTLPAFHRPGASA
ncbi:MAG: phosphosulfolactate synthase [Solirubrobacterales bacterium]|nr:phosphosulfolactate synthase [Solirubrobacterales bacterium]